jgi:outer membrane protein assembly factor BamB
LRWRRSVGTVMLAGPAVASYAGGRFTLAVYAVSGEGLVACLHPADGRVLWTRDLSAQTKRDVQVMSAPVVVTADDAGARRHVYFGAMLGNHNSGSKAAAIFRIEDVVE